MDKNAKDKNRKPDELVVMDDLGMMPSITDDELAVYEVFFGDLIADILKDSPSSAENHAPQGGAIPSSMSHSGDHTRKARRKLKGAA